MLRLLLDLMYAVDDRSWERMFPDDTNPTRERERARIDEAAMAEARRIDALDVPEPFSIDRVTGRYFPNPERLRYDMLHGRRW